MDKFLEGEIRTESEELKKAEAAIGVYERMLDVGSKNKKSSNSVYEVTLLCPYEFEVFRRKNEINLELFIKSVAGAEAWMATGGKSGCSFMRSFNNLIIIKRIRPK
jgi:hypothetical protein